MINLIYIYLAAASLLTMLYAYIQFANAKNWQALPTLKVNSTNTPVTIFSIIIPVKNELANLPACLNALFAQNYPENLFEVIIVNDHSDDGTAAFLDKQTFSNLKIIHLGDKDAFGKKAALKAGIRIAKGEWIATSDGDCQVPIHWLICFDDLIRKRNLAFIGGPVILKHKSSFLEKFQAIDTLGMMGVTGAGIQDGSAYLANGANLTFKKSAFESVLGYKNIDHLASGDDMLLLQKLAIEFPKGIAYVKAQDQWVTTDALTTWKELWQQRLRWASKGNSFPDRNTWMKMVGVYLFCASLLISFILAFTNQPAFIGIFAFQLVTKLVSDAIVLQPLIRFFEQPQLQRGFIFQSFFHAIYMVAVGTAAQFIKTYSWKGRTTK